MYLFPGRPVVTYYFSAAVNTKHIRVTVQCSTHEISRVNQSKKHRSTCQIHTTRYIRCFRDLSHGWQTKSLAGTLYSLASQLMWVGRNLVENFMWISLLVRNMCPTRPQRFLLDNIFYAGFMVSLLCCVRCSLVITRPIILSSLDKHSAAFPRPGLWLFSSLSYSHSSETLPHS